MADQAPAEDLNVGLLLYIPYRELESRVLQSLAAAGYADITPAQARVFQRIGAGGSRLTSLAEQARVTKQTAGFLVDQLECAGYVQRVTDPDDGRARLIRVAKRGALAVRVAAAAVADVEAEWTAHLGVRRMAQLRQSLATLRQITDPLA